MRAEKERYKRIRGFILKFLAYRYPGAEDIFLLQRALDDVGFPLTPEKIKSHVGYLEEKALVKIDKRKVDNIEIDLITITARGIDVLDGNVNEVGVDTNF